MFGEITFYPWRGYVTYIPASFDYELGASWDISDFSKRSKNALERHKE